MNMCDYCGESFQNAEKDPMRVVMGITRVVLSIFFMRSVVTVNLFSDTVLNRMFPLLSRG